MIRDFPSVESACAAAAAAFDAYRRAPHEQRAALLEAIGEEIEATGALLIDTAVRESRLPRARIEGERGRTIGQLRLFASVVRAGHFLGVRIDRAQPERQPQPKPDLRLRMTPVGPVAVFGASNFPLAFSTAGGDTASALAAGCPVVVKAHPAHPETSAIVAAAIKRALARMGLPEGVFNHIAESSHDVGAAIVRDPRIAAVGFTGSRTGGLALQKIAQARAVPIPVYAEMSSINPVVLAPNALERRGLVLAKEFVASMTLGAGQFCTNPGLVIGIDGPALSAFEHAVADAVTNAPASDMLHDGIVKAYDEGVRRRMSSAAQCVARGMDAGNSHQGVPAVFAVSAKAYAADAHLSEEIFGATSIIVRCEDQADLIALLRATEGQLTATLHAEPEDAGLARAFLDLMEQKAGRIIYNAWPTGVEVTHAMVHGGPYPATTDGRTTSVGSMAIERFLRPVSYQGWPQDLLPEDLRDEARLPKLVDGVMS